MNYSKFTNLYSLTKTLRFELKPTEETLDLLIVLVNKKYINK
jgi:hypothetical protein